MTDSFQSGYPTPVSDDDAAMQGIAVDRSVINRDAPSMEASRGLALSELFSAGGITGKVFGFIAADDERARQAQQYQVFGNPADAPLTAAEANARYAVPGRLTFTAPVSDSIARWRQTVAQRETFQADVVANADVSWWEKMGATMAGSILDPVGLPLWLIPELAAGRILKGGLAATRLAELGAVSRGALTGAIEGVAGGALYEGANLWISHEASSDYDLGDAMANVMLGGLLGAAGGGIGGWWHGRGGRRAVAPAVLEGMGEDSRKGAFADALDAVIEDRPVDLGAMLRREAELGRIDAEGGIERQRQVRDGDVVPKGVAAERWAGMDPEARLRWAADEEIAAQKGLLAALEGEAYGSKLDVFDAHAATVRERVADLEGRVARGDLRSDPALRVRAGIDPAETTAARAITDGVADWSARGRRGAHPMAVEAKTVPARPAAEPKPKTAKGEKAAPRGEPYADPEVAALAADTEGMMARAGVEPEAAPRTPQRLSDAIAAARLCLAA